MGRHRERLWSNTFGTHGTRVTVCERKPGGPLSLRYWDAGRAGGGNWVWRSLRHADRAIGIRQARELAGQLLAVGIAVREGRLTVVDLLTRYAREVSAHKKGTQPAEDARRVALWRTVLGDVTEVRALDFPTLDRFVRDRRAGTIVVDEHRLTASPSDTTIGADIVFLQSALNWATRVRQPNGARLLETNSLHGYARPKTKNPKRPVASYERFLAVRAKADDVDPQRLFGPFLDLVESIGWRVSAICQLRASDIDRRPAPQAPLGRIRKAAPFDKEGVEQWLPLSPDARAAVDRILEVSPVIGDRPLFPSVRRGELGCSWTRYHARALLERAEKKAELCPLEGGDFHPYRRKWATERKHQPTKDVAVAGGWRDLRSLEQSYQQVDPETLLAVMTEPRKLREVRSGA
jgi:integrase